MTLEDVKKFHNICNDIVQHAKAYPHIESLQYAGQYADAGCLMDSPSYIQAQIPYILDNLKWVRSVWGKNTRDALRELQLQLQIGQH